MINLKHNGNLEITNGIITIDGNQITSSFAGSFTYSELQTIKTNGELKVGSYYLLNDFETIYDRPDYEEVIEQGIVPKITIETVASGEIEPLLLLAISENNFAPQVYSPTYPKDYIEYDFNYNETWVNSSPAKGRITRRVDEFQNEANHDLRTITFKRYDRNGDEDYKWVWDSGNDNFILKGAYGIDCYSNDKETESYQLLGTFTGFDLDNSVMGNDCNSNKLGIISYNNSIGDFFSRNLIEALFRSNIIKNTFQDNSVKSQFEGNIVEDFFRYNIVDFVFQSNKIKENFIRNTIAGGINSLDFTTATHVYGDYDCEIFRGSDSNIYLKYFDGTEYQFVNPTD